MCLTTSFYSSTGVDNTVSWTTAKVYTILEGINVVEHAQFHKFCLSRLAEFVGEKGIAISILITAHYALLSL